MRHTHTPPSGYVQRTPPPSLPSLCGAWNVRQQLSPPLHRHLPATSTAITEVLSSASEPAQPVASHQQPLLTSPQSRRRLGLGVYRSAAGTPFPRSWARFARCDAFTCMGLWLSLTIGCASLKWFVHIYQPVHVLRYPALSLGLPPVAPSAAVASNRRACGRMRQERAGCTATSSPPATP